MPYMALITKERKSLSIKILYYHVQKALHWTQECRSKWGKPKHTYTSNTLQTEIRGLGQSSTNSCGAGADLGGGCRGCAPLPEMICGVLIQLMFTSGHHSVTPFLSGAPPPKKFWIRPCGGSLILPCVPVGMTGSEWMTYIIFNKKIGQCSIAKILDIFVFWVHIYKA